MFVILCVSIAAVIFAAAVLKAFRHRHAVSRRITILLAGICFSGVFMFLPVYWELSQEFDFSLIRTAAYAIHDGLKAISGGQEIGDIEKLNLESAPSLIRTIYFVLNYVWIVAAPLLTSSLIISLIGDLADRFLCRCYRGGRYHVFSELNDNTLRLAKKIREKHPKEMLVFCDAKNASKEQVTKAKTMGALALHASCKAARLPWRKKNIQFYLVSSNEDVNLCDAEALICRYRNKTEGDYVINAFAESGTGIQVIENMERGNIGVRFVDVTALNCSDLLLQHPLHDLPEGRKTVSAMIVGCGRTGMRMLKTLTWCAAAEGYQLKIRVYDQEAEFLQKKLSAECPELLPNCDVAFVTADARTAELEAAVLDPINGSADATFVLLAMADDEMNIDVAQRLSRLFRYQNRYAWMPQILVRIRNAAKLSIYKEQENPYLKQQRIYPFGGGDDIFLQGALHHSSLENLAFAVDLCYNGLLPKKDPMTMSARELRDYFTSDAVQSARSRFLQSEYNRRSSMAVALHIPVKLRCCGILPRQEMIPTPETAYRFRKALEEDPSLLDTLARSEHLRWNRFMRSEGYVRATWEDLLCFYPVLEKKNNQDALSKRHLCLVEWEELDEINEKYLSLNPPVKKDFKKSDYDLIRYIPDIILVAKRMEEVSMEELA